MSEQSQQDAAAGEQAPPPAAPGEEAATMSEDPTGPAPDGDAAESVPETQADAGPLTGEDDGPPPEGAQSDHQGDAEEAEPDPLAQAEHALEERTADLKRLQAEFVNYKRRVDRDRELLKENARYEVLAPIVEVLDTVDRAREHGELEPGLKTVADQLERTVEKHGLTKFGDVGDVFDPTLHEALSHMGEDAEVEVTTCKVIAKAGYRIGDRVVRAAQVLVVDPPADGS